jgi:hypothetical protein
VSAACLSDPVLSARPQKISRPAHWLSEPDLRQDSHVGLNKGEQELEWANVGSVSECGVHVVDRYDGWLGRTSGEPRSI